MPFTEETTDIWAHFDIERILVIWNSVVKEYFLAHLFQLITVT